MALLDYVPRPHRIFVTAWSHLRHGSAESGSWRHLRFIYTFACCPDFGVGAPRVVLCAARTMVGLVGEEIRKRVIGE